MTDDSDLASLMVTLYRDTPPVHFWDHLWPLDGSYCAHKRTADADIIIWRGSVTTDDWLQDLLAYPVDDPQLGMCHAGFLKGVQTIMDRVYGVLPAHGRIVSCGHSLGAGHATIFSGWMIANHPAIDLQTVLWGSPRAGFSRLAHMVAKKPVRSYRNRTDPVTEVPSLMAPRELWQHPDPLIPVDVAPDFADSWGLLADHHMKYYLTAMEALATAPRS